MTKPIKVYGIKTNYFEDLKATAYELTGKPSISLLAKTLLLEKIGQSDITPSLKSSADDEVQRIEVRLDKGTIEKLNTISSQVKMTPNNYIRMLTQASIRNTVALPTRELEALYQSNIQLLKIGRNINQIAKAINSNTATNLTTETLNELQEIIEHHTKQVGQLLQENNERLP